MSICVPVYEVKAGYGRFSAAKDKDGAAILYHLCADDHLEPGSEIAPEHIEATRDQWVPVFGIKLTRSGSARAWQNAFGRLAAAMEAKELADTVAEV